MSSDQKREMARHRAWRKTFDPAWQRMLATKMGDGWKGLPKDDIGLLYRDDVVAVIGEAEQMFYSPTDPETTPAHLRLPCDPMAAAKWLAESLYLKLTGGDYKTLPRPPGIQIGSKVKRKTPTCEVCGTGKPSVCRSCYDKKTATPHP